MCRLAPEEVSARAVLQAAQEAGFKSIQVTFPWAKVDRAYLRAIPAWIQSEGLKVEALGVYVNCCDPKIVLMDARPEHLPLAMELAGNLDCRFLVAWTGGYNANMAVADTRNTLPAAEDAICRFLSLYAPALERSGLTLALESYITLACPDAPSLRRTLNRLPGCIGAVMDPPNLTPVSRYAERDQALREMFVTLRGRISIVHMKDFRLNAARDGYSLPGPLDGETNYRLFLQQALALPARTPLIVEHIPPERFSKTRARLVEMFP